jgi:histidine triad (HIT) family protein
MEIVFSVNQEGDGGFVAECLTHDIFTEGNSWEEMRSNVQEAVAGYFFDRNKPEPCLFCKIGHAANLVKLVFEDDISIGFLDHRPVFPGHCLLIPKQHFETLADLPADLIEPFFKNVQLLAKAVELGMRAEGTFVAMNNKVSQSVPHLHVHIVPRRRKDGLRGFFWPRNKYQAEEEADLVQSAIREAISALSK